MIDSCKHLISGTKLCRNSGSSHHARTCPYGKPDNCRLFEINPDFYGIENYTAAGDLK
jgi:hypothetical protein